MNIVTDAASKIVMISTGTPTPPTGGSVITLTKQQETDFNAMSAVPNGGITFDGVAFSALPFVSPPAIDWSNVDNHSKAIRAIGLMIANFTGKTPAQVKAAFITAWNALP